MGAGEAVGYLAAALVLATFTMRTMIPLRILGICSNLAFMLYGLIDWLLPVLILHAILLPLNVYRLVEIRRTIAMLRRATAGPDRLDWLIPFMVPARGKAGSVLFRKDDEAGAMYLVVSGRVRLIEFDVELGAGEVLGEIGLFAPDGRRTATAECVGDCELLRISGDKVRELALQNPTFAFHMIGVISGRLVEDVRRLERRFAELRARSAGG